MIQDLSRIEAMVFKILSVGLVLFYILSATVVPAATEFHRGIYVFITYVLVFLLYKSPHPALRPLDYLLMLLSIISISYWIYNYEALNYRAGAETQMDMIVAVTGVLLGIEVARRVIGSVFVILAGLLLIYGVYGMHFPILIAHPGASFPELCTTIFYKEDGVFGLMANVLATYVVLFVIFGAFMERSGAQRFFIDFPLAAVGHRLGGPGKMAVLASGLFGSISGSAIANTVSTGAFTIPLMKKAGFRPHVAGGIEPAASIGGMFMPPIMGAGGFIMAELTGIPYPKIMLIALFPALMYFFSVFVMIHYEAKIHNIQGSRSGPTAMVIFKREWYYMTPLLLITIVMLSGFSPGFAAVTGIISCVAVSWVKTETRMGVTGFIEAACKGTENSLKIGGTVGVIGIIISVLTLAVSFLLLLILSLSLQPVVCF